VPKWTYNANPRDARPVLNPPSELVELFDEYRLLVEIPSAPGFEHGVAIHLAEVFARHCDEVRVDHMGNVFGIRRGSAGGPVFLCLAHTDSTSFITQYIEATGYVRFANQGLIPPYLAYGQRVEILTAEGRITGVVGTKPGHSTFSYAGGEGYYWPHVGPEGGMGVPMYDDMFVDVGARSRDEAEAMGLRPGQQMVYERDLRWLGDGRNGLVTCRGNDDKCGVQAMVEAMKLLHGKELHPTVYFVGAVQEEVGLRGALNAATLVNPDLCIGVDGDIAESGPASDLGLGVPRNPQMGRAETAHVPGAGVYISVNDILWSAVAGLVGNFRVNERLIELAEKHGIPHEVEGNCRYITSDPAAAQFAGAGGTPAVTLKVPVRYTHGPVEVCSLWDVLAAGRLLAAFVEEAEGLDMAFVDLAEADRGLVKRRDAF
jgi:endoglucanase